MAVFIFFKSTALILYPAIKPVVNEFELDTGLCDCKLDDIKEAELSEYIKAGTHANQTVDYKKWFCSNTGIYERKDDTGYDSDDLPDLDYDDQPGGDAEIRLHLAYVS